MKAKFRVEIAASAERDVLGIRDHIAGDKPAAARKWVAEISRLVRSLARLPGRYAVIPESALFGVEYRHAVAGNYRVIYRVERERVIVVRVVRGAQELRGMGSEPSGVR